MTVTEAIENRFSCRAFLPDSVPATVVQAILNTAKRAPSSVNTQPWHVAVITGDTKHRLEAAMEQAFRDGVEPNNAVQSYPDTWFEPYNTRRKNVGKAMYGALGIGREDSDRQQDQWAKNYRAFDAPVMLLIFIDDLPEGALLDVGLFVQNVMLLACEKGLATCPQYALGHYPSVVSKHVPAFADKTLVCGLSLGYPDADAPVNQWRTERADLTEFVVEYA